MPFPPLAVKGQRGQQSPFCLERQVKGVDSNLYDVTSGIIHVFDRLG